MIAHSDASLRGRVGHLAWVVSLDGTVVAEGRMTTRPSPTSALELRAARCAIQACREVAKTTGYVGPITLRTDCRSILPLIAAPGVAVEWERRGVTRLGQRADTLASGRTGWRR